MEYSVEEIREKLAASDFLGSRTAEDPPIVLMPGLLLNRSADRISNVDQMAAVTRLMFEPSIFAMFRDKNVRYVLPSVERWRLTRYEVLGTGVTEGEILANQERPTHFLNARFGSLTRTGADNADKANNRKDVFRIEFAIVNAESGEFVWVDSVEFARISRGTLAD